MLVCHPGAVGLRQAARLAEVHPHSAELVLVGLVREKLVKRERTAARTWYELDRDHADVPVLDAMFTAAARTLVGVHSRSLQERGKRILPFIGQAARMLARARGTRHVT